LKNKRNYDGSTDGPKEGGNKGGREWVFSDAGMHGCMDGNMVYVCMDGYKDAWMDTWCMYA